ncbi:P26 [Chrysodeixis chalcites nucleopolyhedrovirus]|uniref:p26 n=1 Tax=Chrysodeixis chalcites nucleopolyhedrovirus TaxID=320432 RepID=Q4KT61_9ABAC|nr:P26 [Chrysodeixis chalcites nucleopolyhedrovirus]AGC36234.1 P26 protein [Chrysodeixis chalcites SNPV TF1-A]AAY83950.1 P26 [Chrysodeixis chalcites nucleopolyhedrovirus]AGE61281.1 P26 protein [Chrysodeixis chalcites nucleopolyhedrovirus]AGE61430.1 P26 protein [Chrysodeixis chalcites nucleopolyhedrovirus]AGE61579.1 P26 protein [Chrysodeixis chalcites nucleopolyhedrovirus]
MLLMSRLVGEKTQDKVLYKMIQSQFILSFMLTIASASMASTPTTTRRTKLNVEYSIDENEKIIRVVAVDGKAVRIETIRPHSDSNYIKTGDDQPPLSVLHHFPGVASDIVFPAIDNSNDSLMVLLNDGILFRVQPEHVYTNFHRHANRLIYGQLRTFAVDDLWIADKIWIGAPIFFNDRLVSVITCRYDDYDAGIVLFPVSGIRPKGLVSGQINYDSTVYVSLLRNGMSVYGKRQMAYSSPYMTVKKFALSTTANRLTYRDLPRNIAIFHNKKEISISLVEGEYEIDRIRLDGPLIVPQ